MRQPCESIVSAILPALRSLIAKELTEQLAFSQVEAARKMGTTQAAISQYLSRKRGNQLTDTLEEIPEVKSAVHNVAADLAVEESLIVDSIEAICDLCRVLRNDSVVCALHRNTTELPQGCQACQR
ncbi:MAG: transcriptional regulator [Candidatus Thorarchaeota archaeon]